MRPGAGREEHPARDGDRPERRRRSPAIRSGSSKSCGTCSRTPPSSRPRAGASRCVSQRSGSHARDEPSPTRGVGIAAEFLPYVFDRFRQQEGGTRRRYGGLGLGLAIVRHLVELHGGSVTAESDGEGRGATFKVILPLQAASSPPNVPERRPVGSPVQPAARLDGIRVLVVDDEPEARELFASILETAGAHVITASSASEHSQFSTETCRTCSCSDIEMPDEDGYELAERRSRSPTIGERSSTRSPSLPMPETEDRLRALDHGYQWHLSKPVEPSELVKSSRRWPTHRLARRGCISRGATRSRAETGPPAPSEDRISYGPRRVPADRGMRRP